MPGPLVRRLRLLAHSLALLTALPAFAAPIPPGMEARVETLLKDPPLPAGWTLEDVRILPTGIEVPLAGPTPETLVLREKRVEDPAGRRLGRTRSFSVWLVPPEAPEAPAKAVFETLDQRDDGTFWDEAAALAPAAEAAAQARDLGTADDLRRAVSWIAMLALFGFALFSASKRTLAVGLGVFAIALAVRLTVPTPAPMHANGHGIAELRGLAGWPGHDVFEPETDRYGLAYRQIVRTFHGDVDTVFHVAQVAGALAAAAAFALALALGADLRGSALAGLAVALFAPHVWLSASESPNALAGALWFAGAACFVAAARGRAVLAFAGALALGSAAELGLTTLALPAGAVLLVLVAVPFGELRARWRPFSGAFALLAAMVALHAYALGPVFRESQSRASELPQSIDRLQHGGLLLATPELAGGLLVLAVISLILAYRHVRAAIGVVVMTALALAPAVLVNVALTDRVRYQTVPLTALAILAGLAFSRRNSVVSILGLGLVIGTSVPELVTIARTKTLETQAWSLLRNAKVPENGVIRVPARRLGDVIAEFPEYVFPPTVRVSSRPEKGACFVWIGPACWSFTREELAAGLLDRSPRFDDQPIRPECAELTTMIDPQAPAQSVRADVPWRDDEFHRIPNEHPLLGLFPCR